MVGHTCRLNRQLSVSLATVLLRAEYSNEWRVFKNKPHALTPPGSRDRNSPITSIKSAAPSGAGVHLYLNVRALSANRHQDAAPGAIALHLRPQRLCLLAQRRVLAIFAAACAWSGRVGD